ncbi:MAG: hypothetical protein H6Q32_1179 [Bacteroidetes bacterium]|nr:hypothetical protein [Bacteroidota bacterium]
MRSGMKITPGVANTYGWFSIAVMVVLFILVLMDIVPRTWYYPLLGVAVALYMVRVTMRLILARQARVDQESKKKEHEDASGTGPGS